MTIKPFPKPESILERTVKCIGTVARKLRTVEEEVEEEAAYDRADDMVPE